MNANSERIIELFSQAMAKPAEERVAFLDEACRGEPEVRAQVESLLRAEPAARDFLKLGDMAPTVLLPTEKAGDRIGRYKLLQRIGEGGCGVVYMAEQEEPVRRRVALKVIKLGMDTKEVIARFEAERQALALMDHPHIAKVFDAGATETGRPYFVMELVRGVKMTEFCDEGKLSTQDRLKLFVQVCQAIQHAHQKGVIHRDIKPSNILVTINDAVPVPKVIDFGIAKATQGRLTDQTLFTAFEQFIGTPAYMSPEQAVMTSLDIDTRSDIYSLGVLLYQLLTGKTPFDGKELLAAGLDEMRRTIREVEPVRPSTRLTQELVAADASGSTRSALRVPRSAFPTDLDWIVMKCLEKDRTRRYETASGLARDIERHLSNEPVTARPPSALYRFQKSVRRNKLAFAAAAAVATVLVLGVVASTWQAIRATRAEREQARSRQEAEAHRHQALEAVRELQLQRVEDLLEQNHAAVAVGHLARILRNDPSNRVAAMRLMSVLSQRSFALPATPPLHHSARVNWASFSPDGERVVTASADHTGRIWDSRTGEPLGVTLQHTGEVHVANFSPDGQRLVTASADRTARVWDARSGRPLGPTLVHPREVTGAAFSPDGEVALTICADNAVRLWDARSGEIRGKPLQHASFIRSVRFSRDGTRLVSTSYDWSAVVWDATDGKALVKLSHPNRVEYAVFSPDGRRVATANYDGKGRLWETASGQNLAEVHHSAEVVECVAFNPNNVWATASRDGTVRLWDGQAGESIGQPFVHHTTVLKVAFTPDGRRLLATCQDGSAWVWEVDSRELACQTIRHDFPINCANFRADGQGVVTACNDKAYVWDVRPGAMVAQRMLHGDIVARVAFSSDGRRVATGCFDGSARVWDARTAEPLTPPLRHGSWLMGVQFDLTGEWLLTCATDGTASVWNSQTGQPRFPCVEHGIRLDHAEFSPDGSRFVTASRNGTVQVWDSTTGRPVGPLLQLGGNWLDCARFSPDGRRVVSCSINGTARVWEVATGQPVGRPLSHEGHVWDARFSPDGQRLVTASSDMTARVWDVQTSRALLPALRHHGIVRQACFSSDSRRIFTMSHDRTARLWDAQTGEPLGEPMRHSGDVHRGDFSRDGRWVATASADGTARVWDGLTGRPLTDSLRHGSWTAHLSFSPDQQWIATASTDRTARIWEVPEAPVPVPAWLAELAETVVSLRRSAAGNEEFLSPVDFLKVRERLAGLVAASRESAAVSPGTGSTLTPEVATDQYALWARWFFADRSTRTISSHSPVTVPQYVRQRLVEDSETSVQEALKLDPTNGLAWARLARLTLGQSNSTNRPPPLAEHASRMAVQFAPAEAEAWWAQAETLERSADWVNAELALRHAVALQPDNAALRAAESRLLGRLQKFEEALEAASEAVKAAEAAGEANDASLQDALLKRRQLLLRLDRTAEAQADFLRAKNITARDPQCSTNCLDLSPYYNAALGEDWHNPPGTTRGWNLGSLPTGRQIFGGVEFDVRGVVQLSCKAIERDYPEFPRFPKTVPGIAVGQRCRALHFLHASIWSERVRNGAAIGRYLVHYADGRAAEIPNVHGEDSRAWQIGGDRMTHLPHATIPWSGKAPNGTAVRLFKRTWPNPRPEVPVESLELHSGETIAGPFVIAITAEP